MQLHHDFAQKLPHLVRPTEGEEQPHPEMVILNEELAMDLGLDPTWLRSSEGIEFLTGRAGGHAMAYSGFQFGAFNPQMGDGRAMLLGEVEKDGRLWDLHAKGTGLTPYSRLGSDGRGTLSSMLREYLVSEAMHALGVPTTRALAVISTGRPIQRGHVQPAGIVVRVAASHIRVGTFHLAAQTDYTRQLADYAIARHYPGADYQEFFTQVMDTQIRTVSQWMRLGFIHGVMNTDNTTISGETIDYGPCAFMEAYSPDTVFSSIDRQGRYAFGNQPSILGWNLARLAESLLPLFDMDMNKAMDFAQETINGYTDRFEHHRNRDLAKALDTSLEIASSYSAAMWLNGPDITLAHRALADAAAGHPTPARELLPEGDFVDEYLTSSPDPCCVDRAMPRVIPRNLAVEAALSSAERGEMGPFRELLDAVTHPWEPHPSFEAPDPHGLKGYLTYCGT
ncbi:protein adenylyltransferase SelO family protein [Corynebacterium sp. c8Ua_181]|uniref:Protein nucleotidyltransferase YdiU n=1 Tax=Corynebacterium curieae TaxID=2913500 RepID=A0A9X3RSK8_9CORY|nr:protein adenylyltransferase SelO family protein [Corynebacterium curieae]MCZ9306187.1 protein adenylyltransferase SelO family protein [Corynebacterium curieae]